MILALISRFVCNISSHLYPAYASYKALATPLPSRLRPYPAGTSETAQEERDKEVERWLMYWAVVGVWSGVEGGVGWVVGWIPFYSFFKCLFFLWLSLPQTQGSTLIFNSLLAPFFDTHELEIDAFLADLKSKAGGMVLGLGGWFVEWVKGVVQSNLNLSPSQFRDSINSNPNARPTQPRSRIPSSSDPSLTGGVYGQIGDGQYHGHATSPQPPTMHDPASGVMQQAWGMGVWYAARYLPVAMSAIASASAAASQSVRSTAPPYSTEPDQSSGRIPVARGGEFVEMPEPFPTGGPFAVREQEFHTQPQPQQPQLHHNVPSSFAGRRSSSNTMRHASGSFASGLQQMDQQQQQQETRLRPKNGRYSVSGSSGSSEVGVGGISPVSAQHTGSSKASGASQAGSGGGNWGGASGYEEITRDEVIYDDATGRTVEERPGRGGRRTGSWFGWGGEQERDKTE